ncbi:MAG: hypothetical protein Q4Q07_08620 [Tissierellia bacterium]|nr:hypothetical protein [Tissierellia bacterium]
MSKYYKRLLSLTLAMVMCFIYPVNSFAFSKDSEEDNLIKNKQLEIEHRLEVEEDDIWETYDEIDGVKYYFKDTPQYTINIIEDTVTHIYIKDKSENTIKVYEKNSNSMMNNSMLDSEKFDYNFGLNNQDIKKYVENCALKEEYNVKDFEISELRASEYEIARRIDKKLAEYYGSTYSDKYIDSMREKGKQAKLYKSMHFER